MDPADGEVPKTIAGPAVQKLKSLAVRWGSEVKLEDWTRAPQLISVKTMGSREVWRLRTIHPTQEKPKAIGEYEYELIEKEKL